MLRRAFTVLEIVVAVFILALMSAAIIPALMGRIRDAQSSALSQTLFSLSLAIFEYRKAVSVNPEQLIQLAAKPSATDNDACSNDITAANVNNWRGPYVSRELLSGGIGIGDAKISNILARQAAAPTTLFIDVEFVDAQAAIDIDRAYDGQTDTPTTGTVRYQTAALVRSSPAFTTPAITYPAAPTGMVTLSYGIPITGC